jgi:DNA-binding MarR family transcriptional regulator
MNKDPDGPAISLDRVIAIAAFQATVRRFVRQSERIANQHELTPQRYLLLLMIKGAADRSERLSVGAVAERLQLGDNTTTELINRAEKNGLLRRQRNAEDGRVVDLRLTDEGNRRLAVVLRELDSGRHELEEALRSLTQSFRRTA